MSQYSTSKILGKLAIEPSKIQDEDVLPQEAAQVMTDGEAVPQLKPSNELQMKEVLMKSLGASFSKDYSPMD